MEAAYKQLGWAVVHVADGHADVDMHVDWDEEVLDQVVVDLMG